MSHQLRRFYVIYDDPTLEVPPTKDTVERFYKLIDHPMIAGGLHVKTKGRDSFEQRDNLLAAYVYAFMFRGKRK